MIAWPQGSLRAAFVTVAISALEEQVWDRLVQLFDLVEPAATRATAERSITHQVGPGPDLVEIELPTGVTAVVRARDLVVAAQEDPTGKSWLSEDGASWILEGRIPISMALVLGGARRLFAEAPGPLADFYDLPREARL